MIGHEKQLFFAGFFSQIVMPLFFWLPYINYLAKIFINKNDSY